jgi:ABC-type branched-subunit amino acid transport system permease subunit
VSPNLVGGINWAIGGAVAGLFGALIATVSTLAPGDFSLFVIEGISAAMIGGMISLGWTAAAGIGIGMLESYVLYLSSRYSFLPQQGLPDLVPLLILVVVMLIRSKPLPERGSLIRKALPAARPAKHVWQWTVILSCAAIVLALTLKGNYLIALTATLVGVFFAFSIVLLTGYVGQISLGTYMFAGVAAFFMSRLTVEWGVPFPLAPIISAIVAALVGALVAIPAVRVRGINLAILTLALALTVEDMYFANPKWVGSAGSPTEKPPTLFGLQLGIALHKAYPRPEFALMVLVFAIPIVLLVVGVRRSSLGLQMLAVRANERAAAANGVNVFIVKLIGFTLAAFIAGLGGAFLGYMNYGGISAASFDVLGFMVPLLAIVMISGVSSVSGGVLAAIGIAGGLSAFILQDLFNAVVWIPVVSSVGLMFAAVTIPDGIAGQLSDANKVGSVPWLWDRIGKPVVRRGATLTSSRAAGAPTPNVVAIAAVAKSDVTTTSSAGGNGTISSGSSSGAVPGGHIS